MAYAGPILKPSALDRQIEKYKRRMAKAKDKRAEERREREAWSVVRKAAFVRDRGRCRAFGTPLSLVTANPELLAHAHHVVFRSAGGSDDLSNVCTLSPRAHEMVHRHMLDVEGDANATLTFRQRHPETGRIEREWEG